MSRVAIAAILLGAIVILYGVQTYAKKAEKKAKEARKDEPKEVSESFVDASGTKLDASGAAVDYGFAEIFAKFLNKLVDNVNFTPSDETEKVLDIVSTPDQELINMNMEKQMTPMIVQGIDALRLASSAQNNY